MMVSRNERPEPRWKARLAAARTPPDQFAAARDAFTASLATFGRRRTDGHLEAKCQAEAAAIMREAAAYLVASAEGVYQREREIRNAQRRGHTP